ncbi:hypothetical protein E4T38_09671 [Aureobasidium subglaciale]|nr:hypothetical protein E4T38_09671 [Aureobasidium subglaciale]KAI5213604.1 hypothetical protein E4T40_09613 [Aureobasidium subglaciale]KAI5215270.1 hypothetical protein E4T41_09651 [Aureobasidium subglaciale]KAI5253267.1 hypothetical protein E4T46_09628 [Aureobasidium subglaciale]
MTIQSLPEALAVPITVVVGIVIAAFSYVGDYVRYAPNRVMFYSADSARDIYGNKQTNIFKSKVYDTLRHRAGNTLTLRNKQEHARRRRIMSSGFSDASLRSLEPKILAQVGKLIQGLTGDSQDSSPQSSVNGTTIRNMAFWCDHHAFDLMSSLIFSTCFDTLAQPDFRYVPRSIESSNERMSVILQAPELMLRRLDKKLFPRSIQDRNKFLQFLGHVIGSRTKTTGKQSGQDIFSFFEDARDPETGEGFKTGELLAESATLIVAGSDTTSVTLSGVFHYLGQHKSAYDLAAAEVRNAFESRQAISIGSKLASCVYLRACVEETLRMSPPTGSALWREVGEGGAYISDQFIPQGCDVGVGIYAIHHNPAYHIEPFEFRPERFLGVEEYSMSRQAFMPFSFGSRGCIGKGLAMTEIMLTMASVLWTCDFKESKDEVLQGEYALKDHIVGARKGPKLEFCRREL